MGMKQQKLQITFNSESEKDVIEFFSNLNETEAHVTAISALRIYMRATGFYESRKANARPFQTESLPGIDENVSDKTVLPDNIQTEEGIYDEEAIDELSRMFDKENEMGEE